MALVTEYLLTPCESDLNEALRLHREATITAVYEKEPMPCSITPSSQKMKPFAPKVLSSSYHLHNPYHSMVMNHNPELSLFLYYKGKCFMTQVKF